MKKEIKILLGVLILGVVNLSVLLIVIVASEIQKNNKEAQIRENYRSTVEALQTAELNAAAEEDIDSDLSKKNTAVTDESTQADAEQGFLRKGNNTDADDGSNQSGEIDGTEANAVRDDADQDGTDAADEEQDSTGSDSTKKKSTSASAEDQVQCLVDHYSVWSGDVLFPDYEYSSYCLTDLDRDGLLEIKTTVSGGTGYFTRFSMFEVNDDLSGLLEVFTETGDDPDAFGDLNFRKDNFSQTEFTGYDDSGIYYYFAENSWRNGYVQYGAVLEEVTMVDNQVRMREIASTTASENNSGGETVTREVGGVTYDSEEAWQDAVRALYDNTTEFTYTLRHTHDLTQDTMYGELLKLANEVI